MRKRILYLLLAVLPLLFTACEPKVEPTPEPGPVAPTSITLSASTFEVAQAGGKLSLTIQAPSRPSLSGLPSWISYTDGTFNKYSITVGLTVAANDCYDARSVEVTVSSAGASAVKFSV